MKTSSCDNYTGIVVSEPENTGKMLVAEMRCKMWSCAYCANVNRNIWRTHIINRIEKLGGEWCFITLTAHEKAHKANKTLENLRDGWKTLYDRLRRYFAGSEKLEYVRVFEKHKTGRFHIHAIIRAKIPDDKAFKRWLKKNARECGMGYQADAKNITGDGSALLVASYICKYMTKDAQNLGDMPKGLRRIQASHGIGAAKPNTPKYDWRVRAGVYLQDVKEHDYVIDVGTGEVITDEYFKWFSYYPEHSRIDKEDNVDL